jgi:hypothetical protein
MTLYRTAIIACATCPEDRALCAKRVPAIRNRAVGMEENLLFVSAGEDEAQGIIGGVSSHTIHTSLSSIHITFKEVQSSSGRARLVLW